MTLKLSSLTHTRMDLELLNFINVDMKWNIMKKGRTSMTRRPRKPGADGFELVYNSQEPLASESKKSGPLKVVDAPLKKRRILHQSRSPPGQTRCIKGEGLLPGPQTPSVHHEDSGQQCRSSLLTKCQKTKSKTRLRNSKMKKKEKVLKPDDFSGIELLADVACSILTHDNADHVEDFSISKEHATPEVKTCGGDIKEAIVSPGSNCSAVQQVHDNGKEVEEKKVAPSKGLRLHWDLNTVMDDWQDPCDDLQIEPVKHDGASISVIPLTESSNVDSCKERYEVVEDLKGAGGKTDIVKTSDGESSASKSEVVDSLTQPKCEDLCTSTTSALNEQTIVKCESATIDGVKLDQDQQPVSDKVIQGFCDNKVATDYRVSECCCSNVTREEQGHMADGDLEEKNQAGYDSPFEDGELREPLEKLDKVTVFNESRNLYRDDFGTVENICETKQGVQVDTFESGKDICERKGGHGDESRPVGGNLSHIDESTSFDVCRNGEYIHRSRSSNIGDSRIWDLKSHRSLDRNYSRNYNSRGGGYRAQDRRPSPSERNSYGSYKGQPPARSHGGDRYRYHSLEYNDHKPCYSEVKPHFSPGYNRPGAPSRSRSGSPIAWHFRKNLDTSNSAEIKTGTRGGHLSPERSSKCIDDHYRFRDDQFRDKRRSPGTMVQQKQRYDPTERLKSDDCFRSGHRPARFSHKYKENSDDFRKHDSYHEKVNRVGRSVDDGVRRFRYAHNRE